jgi:hypothetical protein
VLAQPPYALAPVLFRFRALATLAGRLPLGGERELAMTLLLGARLGDGCLPHAAMTRELRKARAAGARHWIGALALPAAVRAAAYQVADATGGESKEGVATALERLMGVAAAVLDTPSRAELKQLVVALRAA